MKTLIVSFLFWTGAIFAQLSAPNVENVYGGRILDISGYAKNSDTTRYFISTESANSIFYTDAYTNTSSPSVNTWTVMPGVDASAGYGSGITRIEAHETSGYVIFKNNDGIYSSSPSSTTVNTIHSGYSQEMCLDGDYFFFQTTTNLRFGTIDGSGNFVEDAASPLSLSLPTDPAIFYIHPVSGILYLFYGGPTPTILKLDNVYSSSSVPTTAIDISPTFTTTGVTWNSFGIGPDGRLFVFGNDDLNRYAAYSDDEINWTEYAITAAVNGIFSPDVAFSGTASDYYVYTSSIYSNYKGESGTWNRFGVPGGDETHPNDGSVFVDPINSNIVLMTTDQGIGMSEDLGETIYEIDDGVEAVQVFDFDMTDSEYTGWLASKSGIRHVQDFKTSPLWTNAMFPCDDGSPYYSVAIDKFDSATVYAGNVRVYKTTNDGASWRQVFTPETPPYNFPHVGTRCNALESLPYEPNIIFAGFEIKDAQKGGLFWSSDSGATWEQILIEASSVGEDVDVMDIVFNLESGDTVAYVGVRYDLSAPQGYSVYRLVKSGFTWTPSQDMGPTGTSTGSVIVVTIYDLEVSESGDTVYAAGTDSGVNEPHVYYKPISSTNLWTPITSSGFTLSDENATAVTVGGGNIYAAVNSNVYYFTPGVSTAWTLGYSYPIGTKINVLFYDQLLVGTSLGFYNHAEQPDAVDENGIETANEFLLMQNYPNPFNPTTNITYVIASGAKQSAALSVQLKVYDALGREVATLVNAKQAPGKYSVQFNAAELPSGIYFYTIKAGNFTATKKMILMK